MNEIRFDGRVAVVTGAGGGLGRTHALLLASRGAKVVVNDLGGHTDGTGSGKAMADEVVAEIAGAGGDAVANYDSVDSWEGGESIVATAVDTYGKLDILINNAGILRDRSIGKMSEDEYRRVIDIHLNGTWYVTRASVPHLRANEYGRIVFTSSGAGLWGNFGQTNYSAAKMGVIGMMHALKLEVRKYNVLVNTIAPIAASRLLGSVMSEEAMDALDPKYVSAIVAYLVSEQCTETGGVFLAGGGMFSRAELVGNKGIVIEDKAKITVESVAEHFGEICDMTEARGYFSSAERRDSLNVAQF